MCKNKYVIILAYAIAVSLLSGCEQDFDLEKYKNEDVERMLVVNSIINPDSVVAVSVTHPYFFSDPHVSFIPDSSLCVKLAGEDGLWETLDYDIHSNMYLSNRRPKEGEVISLNVGGVWECASSCDTIPRKVNIEDVEIHGEGPVHIYWDNDYRFTYEITFSDPPEEENYYFLSVTDDAERYEFSDMGQVDYTVDYVFQVLADMINSEIQGWQPDGVFGYPFSDKGIDGKRYTLTVSEVLQSPLTGMIKHLHRKIKLYSISRSYFKYMVSVLAMDYDESALKGSLLSLGLIEPTKIFSNIEGGTGIMGSYNLSTMRIDLLKETDGWPTK